MRTKQTFVYFAIPTFLLAWLAYFMQTKMFLSSDVAYLLHATSQLLKGGKYVTDIFETNPPMILYLYTPVWLMVKLAFLSVATALRFYVFFLAFLSLSFSCFLLKKIIKPEDKIVLFVIFYTLAVLMFFLPAFSFGQREHLLFIFMMPYLLAAVVRLENKKIPALLSFFIGLLAGAGFALKPFFLVTLCLVELLFIIKKRRLFAWIRIESITVASVLVLHLISVFLFHPDYFQVLLPLIFQFYFIATKQPLDGILADHFVVFCLLGTVAYFIFYRQDKYLLLSTMIWLAIIGMTAAFMIPRAAWFYHQLPALSLVCLLLANYVGQVLALCFSKSRLRQSFQDSIFLLIAMVLIMIVPSVYGFQFIKNILDTYWASVTRQQLTAWISSQAGEHSVFCFTGKGSSDCFPLIYMTQSKYGSRFPFFWWYAGMKKRENQIVTPAEAVEIAKGKKYLIESVAADLDRFKVRWVIINKSEKTGNISFEFINDFSKERKFKEAWRNYTYLTSIDNYQIFERKSNL